jgi:hypothetical protein
METLLKKKVNLKSITFFKHKLPMDNTNFVNQYPYGGDKGYLAIKTIHRKRLEKFILAANGDECNKLEEWVFIDAKNLDVSVNIRVVNYVQMNEYLYGVTSDLPRLDLFDPNEHCVEWEENPVIAFGRITKYESEKYEIPKHIFAYPKHEIVFV